MRKIKIEVIDYGRKLLLSDKIINRDLLIDRNFTLNDFDVELIVD